MAFVLSPSALNYPVDVLLAVILPLHAHVGLNYVISDYVPKATRQVARAGLVGLTVATIAGSLLLTYQGPGLTQTIKGLWQPKKPSA